MIAIQFQRLLHSKFFYIGLIIGSLITVLHYFQTTMTIIGGEKAAALYGKQSIIPDSAYLLWLNASMSEMTDLFFMLLPILAVLPFSIQLLTDKKVNYHQLMMMRSGKYTYLFSMLFISAVAGFLVIVIPILINFLLFSLTFPAISPNPFIYYTYGIYSFKTLFISLQLNYPLMHTLFYILLSGFIGSLFAIFSSVLCLYFRFTLIVLATPVFISLLISVCSEFFHIALSPINFLDMSSVLPVYPWSVLLFCISMIICTLILLIIGVRNLDR
ncbi:hypothetical protein [Bacillus sp. FJAT-47783]|uniref:hypothetical protein n=1 Tax=Bacillus sp. FJAT-47783 TaxID=2922712 RepID=UPI001FAC633D|nr:hypothetical protein [Bacillus sp. FJAT-47783]